MRVLVRASDEGKKLTLIWESKATQALWRQRSIVVKAASTVFHYITHFRKKLFGCNFHFVITTIFISVKLWHWVLENACLCSFRFERRMKLKLSFFLFCRLFRRNHFKVLCSTPFESSGEHLKIREDESLKIWAFFSRAQKRVWMKYWNCLFHDTSVSVCLGGRQNSAFCHKAWLKGDILNQPWKNDWNQILNYWWWAHETNQPSFVSPGESSISFAEVGQMNPGSSLLELKLN